MDSQELQRLKTRYNIVGANPGLERALETAITVAPSDLAVLITGESGVGKDVFPRIIHENSRRKNNKYLAVNCGSIPVGTISAELFGHEKGSFTGAVAERKGYFEEADGGTLFLDEIGEMPRDTQAMLLRVLQDGEYIKVGSSKVEKTNVRVVCATNVNLENLVAQGKFREDLYYRLNGIQIKLPALRERREDISLLFRKFSSDFATENGLCRVSLSVEAIAKMRAYRWPGNIRQLKNFSEAVTLLEGRAATPGTDRIELGEEAIMRHLPQEKDTLIPAIATSAGSGSSMNDDEKQAIYSAIFNLKQDIEDLKKKFLDLQSGAGFEPMHPQVAAPVDDIDEQTGEEPEAPATLRQSNDERIFSTLERFGGDVKLAAEALGISQRTIYRKLAVRKNQ